MLPELSKTTILKSGKSLLCAFDLLVTVKGVFLYPNVTPSSVKYNLLGFIFLISSVSSSKGLKFNGAISKLCSFVIASTLTGIALANLLYKESNCSYGVMFGDKGSLLLYLP